MLETLNFMLGGLCDGDVFVSVGDKDWHGVLGKENCRAFCTQVPH